MIFLVGSLLVLLLLFFKVSEIVLGVYLMEDIYE